jgi:BlaI family transcriptional regulator, penicillinase repressor
MADKGLLEITKIRNLQLFSAKISSDQAKKSELSKLLKRAFDGAMTPMMQFLIEQEGLSKEQLSQLRQMVDKVSKKKDERAVQ